VLQTYLRKNIR